MIIKLELYGASRDFGSKDHLEFYIKEKLKSKTLEKKLLII